MFFNLFLTFLVMFLVNIWNSFLEPSLQEKMEMTRTSISNIWNSLFEPSLQEKMKMTRTSIQDIRSALWRYQYEIGCFPDSLYDLTVFSLPVWINGGSPLLKEEQLFDSWGNPFQYKKLSKYDFEIRSAGPDGQMNTDDDIYEREY